MTHSGIPGFGSSSDGDQALSMSVANFGSTMITGINRLFIFEKSSLESEVWKRTEFRIVVMTLVHLTI